MKIQWKVWQWTSKQGIHFTCHSADDRLVVKTNTELVYGRLNMPTGLYEEMFALPYDGDVKPQDDIAKFLEAVLEQAGRQFEATLAHMQAAFKESE